MPRSARRFGQQPENGENHRFAVEIVDLDLPRGAVELLPYLRHLRKASKVPCPTTEPCGKPVAYCVDEGCKSLRIGTAERVAERMERHGIDRRQRGEQRAHALTHFERFAGKELYCAPDAAVRKHRGFTDLGV